MRRLDRVFRREVLAWSTWSAFTSALISFAIFSDWNFFEKAIAFSWAINIVPALMWAVAWSAIAVLNLYGIAFRALWALRTAMALQAFVYFTWALSIGVSAAEGQRPLAVIASVVAWAQGAVVPAFLLSRSFTYVRVRAPDVG